jgi:hypothetical protein
LKLVLYAVQIAMGAYDEPAQQMCANVSINEYLYYECPAKHKHFDHACTIVRVLKLPFAVHYFAIVMLC